jgi:hypothetical protein
VGASVEIGHAAADSIEIVPIDSDESGVRSFGYDERDTPPSAEEGVSAEAAVPEPALALAATEIETASLPALAGEGAPEVHPAPDTPSATRDVTPVSAEVAEPGQPNEHNSAAVPAVAEPELAQDTSSVSDAAEPAPTQQQEPALLVQEVTKKPENPRRGWWQRLIQS